MKAFMSDIVRGEIESKKTGGLLRHASADVPDASVLKVVVSHVQDSKGVVSPQDGAQMLAVLRSQVVASQPQLLQVLVELHRCHCKRKSWVC